MKYLLYKITLLLSVLLLSHTVAAQYNLLYLDKDPAKAGVISLTTYLETQGYTVTFIESAVFKYGDTYKNPVAYAGYDAIFIGEELGSGDILNFHEAGYPLPCITTEGWAFRNSATKWSWLSDEENQFHQLGGADSPSLTETNTLVFLDEEQTWLGQQYLTGEELIWCNKIDLVLGSNGINFEDVDGAIPFAKLTASALDGFPVGWIFPAGSEVTTDPNAQNGGPVNVTLAHPMVYLGLLSYGQDSATTEFHELIHKSIKYVTDNYEEPAFDTLVKDTICSGDSLKIGDSVFTSTGRYYITLSDQHGSDSIVKLDLQVRKPLIANYSETICFGDSVQFGDSYLKGSGDYTSKFVNQNGCDSIINLSLLVLDQIEANISAAICEGESYSFGDAILRSSGEYTDTLIGNLGCDSIVSLSLSVLPEPKLNLGNDTIIYKNQFVILDAGEHGNYLWSTGQITQKIRIDSLTGLGENVVSVVVSSENECSNSDTVRVAIYNAISGIESTGTLSQIQFYPNPTRGIINIENLISSVNYTIRVFDVSGNQLKYKVLRNNENLLDISELKTGLYFIEIANKEEKITHMIVKE